MEKADSLATNTVWTVLTNNITGNGGTLSATDPGAASLPKRYYRLVDQ